MDSQFDRRRFLAAGSVAAAAVTLPAIAKSASAASPLRDDEKPFEISLAQWSLNRELRNGKLDNLDFAKTAKEMGVHAVEYLSLIHI